MAEATLVRITRGKSGTITAYWADGSVYEYASEAEMVEREHLDDEQLSRSIALKKFLASEPKFAASIDEKTEAAADVKATVDFTKPEIVTVEAKASIEESVEVITKP